MAGPGMYLAVICARAPEDRYVIYTKVCSSLTTKLVEPVYTCAQPMHER